MDDDEITVTNQNHCAADVAVSLWVERDSTEVLVRALVAVDWSPGAVWGFVDPNASEGVTLTPYEQECAVDKACAEVLRLQGLGDEGEEYDKYVHGKVPPG